ncbi:hypothetical protein [Methylocucumis oryzae]|uniref:Uncharacterized protein n=1 Tax=Methylocucumis oryzae TaxID=1632867 RepID=A0A0F3IKC8_9GAMM|nr:hypothetical protein [Methylocucumis oryzae]KJV07117.1 hypothetical protein VZ94_06900 [Methylocucumis oryzae]
MNYAEELAYWYLRLNGFFPISNFVVHKSSLVSHTSDIDLLAIRPPFVYEEVGGQPQDWDAYLTGKLDFNRLIGVVCEVKSGSFEDEKLFRSDHLRYTLSRLGLVSPKNIEQALAGLSQSATLEVDGGTLVAKLLASSTEGRDGPYLSRSLSQMEDFLAERVNRYQVRKYGDRMFFPSNMFQLIIAQVHRQIAQRNL